MTLPGSAPAPMDGTGAAGRPAVPYGAAVHPPVVQDGVRMKDRSHLPRKGAVSPEWYVQDSNLRR